MFRLFWGTFPQKGWNIPPNGRHVPQTGGTFPQTDETFPKRVEHSPKRVEHFPKRVEHSPKVVEHSPKRTKHSPKWVEHFPKWVEHFPQRTKRSPNGWSIPQKRTEPFPRARNIPPERRAVRLFWGAVFRGGRELRPTGRNIRRGRRTAAADQGRGYRPER